MRKFQCLLSVLKRSYICYYVICMTVPLRISSVNVAADLVTFTEEIYNGKLQFLCNALITLHTRGLTQRIINPLTTNVPII